MSDLTVNINKTIHAPIGKVFDAWLNPELLTEFILPKPGMPKPEVTNDPRVDGKFEIVMHVGDDRIPHTGTYLEIDRPNKLVFSWESPCSTDDSTVTLLFKKAGDDKTSIELTHVKFINEETRSDHKGGWTNILQALDSSIQKLVAIV